jgi:hypothetical protein
MLTCMDNNFLYFPAEVVTNGATYSCSFDKLWSGANYGDDFMQSKMSGLVGYKGVNLSGRISNYNQVLNSFTANFQSSY